MADERQVDLLRQGPEAWNQWRADRPAAAVDLSNGALRGLNLAETDLTGADLGGADLRGTVLTGARLAGASLVGANLFKADLEGADLAAADLSGVQFLHCAQLRSALNWQSAFRDEDLACGARIPTQLKGGTRP